MQNLSDKEKEIQKKIEEYKQRELDNLKAEIVAITKA